MTLMDNTASTVSDAVLSSERLMYSPERMRTFYGVPADHAPSQAVALPLVGESVQMRTSMGANLTGVWLTLGAPLVYGAAGVPVWLYCDGDAERYICEVGSLDIRQSLQGPAPDDPLIAAQYESLARLGGRYDAAGQSYQQREAERQTWFDGLVSDAHEWAEEHQMCERFDEFMEAHDLPTRKRTYKVTVDVEVSVTLEREASSEGEAESAVDSYDVAEAVHQTQDFLDVQNWSVREVEAD